ncbi:bacterio-opsin activator, partial [Halobacteriales archaeon QH_1_68_42]
MSVIAELRIRTSEFALGQTLEATPDVRVEFERVVTHSQEWIMPFLWV